MTKITCILIGCEHNKGNLCYAKEIELGFFDSNPDHTEFHIDCSEYKDKED